MKDFSYVTNSHPAFIEALYKDFVKDPASVDPDWKKFFEGFDFALANTNGKPATNGAVTATAAAPVAPGIPVSNDQLAKELAVYQLIRAYRKRGHLQSSTNPIRPRKDRHANLDLHFFGLTEADLKTEFYAGSIVGLGKSTLESIVNHLKTLYTSNVGIEYTYINDEAVCKWVEQEYEKIMAETLPIEKKKRILEKLNEGTMFEKFLHTKYIGQKRFSLEGGESTIAALDTIINEGGASGVKEVVIGMAHRGRLNVLANIMRKTYEQIFSEFEGKSLPDSTMGSGDVKYHLGFRSNVMTPAGHEVNLQLCPNPSHLETVNPVVVGFARAKADTLYSSDYDKILPILIHGDASVAGQGIVYEVLQMSNLRGYYTGGTIHFVINNQIGFTTDFDDARSADYCTSVASMVQAPVFHVNGDDPEAVVKVTELAVRFRQEFNRDIFIDMLCYRKHGHNEGDDPKFTQPSLYAIIDKHPNPREVYTKLLIERGDVDAELAMEMEKSFWKNLQDRLDEVKQKPLPYLYQTPELAWQELRKGTAEDFDASPDTSITKDTFNSIFNSIMAIPQGFTPLKKVNKLLEDKIKLFNEKGEIDWATGELMAYASILMDGKDVRMSGQDVQRGTFSHRHAVLRDENTNEPYNRLSRLSDSQGNFRIYNSLLSEYGVLGFEYGYGMANPNTLTLWEAQFGDFNNGAQIMIDQFICSAEQKWRLQNGLVMLLPHGYEGQGPEHSSARQERFLQLCAELNMIVTNITTAANFFHMMRRQLALPFRKPLVNFSPKANLRHVRAYSKMEDFTTGGFKEIIDDPNVSDARKVKRVLLCTGKLYFDLSEKQMTEGRDDIAVVRLEQLYPLPMKQLMELYNGKYKGAQWIWVQEEPRNMGACGYLKMNLDNMNIGYLSREASAATATGYLKKHQEEQQSLINLAFQL